METSAITFRRLTRGDFPRIAGWLAEPHVARWWNHEFTPDALERDFGRGVDGGEPGEDYIVSLDGSPIGLIQFSRYEDYPEYIDELEPLLPVPDGAVTVDYLIGAPELVGRGVGSAMIAAFIRNVWQDNPAATCVIVPVSSANEASWRALLTVGFRVVARGDLKPDNPIDDPLHEILRLDRPAGEGYRG